ITIGDTATSSNNFAVTLQVGSSNHATVGINGSGNNMPLLATFDGDALIAAGSSLATIDSVVGVSVPIIGGYSLLQPGLMTQVGAGNELNMTVSGDTNLFASLQDGNNNDVVHTVTGSSNQVAVLQDGNNNHSSTAQY